ncbi:MAG: hypothetical protein LH616_14455 [Ilumatobacteraceae bacterium]|nr:hypothetical protein [Ilumatobacteraceae bacterium]
MTNTGSVEEPDRIELTINGGKHILIREGRVLEGFYAPTATSRRFHVEHFDAASKPKRMGSGHRVYIGKMMSGTFPDAWVIHDVSNAELPRIEKFIAIAKSRRRPN